MKITRAQTSARTIKMLANFMHRKPAELHLADNLRTKWKLTPDDFEILELWIEQPISPSLPGYFQDVGADVTVADLQNAQKVPTIGTLVVLIWDSIPAANKA